MEGRTLATVYVVSRMIWGKIVIIDLRISDQFSGMRRTRWEPEVRAGNGDQKKNRIDTNT